MTTTARPTPSARCLRSRAGAARAVLVHAHHPDLLDIFVTAP